MSKKPTVLMILDGYGLNDKCEHNAVCEAKTPIMDQLMSCLLYTSVPAIDIIPVVEAAKGSNIQIGAENMYFEEKGAFTGEISPAMLTDAGVKYVVLGLSLIHIS